MNKLSLNSFAVSVLALECKITSLAVEHCAWACYDPLRDKFLKRCHSRKFRESLYHTFEIPKKSGGVRTITAPTGRLKELQKALAIYLSSFYDAPWPVNGFVKGCSVYTNAIAHCGKNYVLNIDLKNFFPSITAKMILDCLRHQGAEKEVAKYVADVCTLGGVLTQGSPTSPIISNMVCFNMDQALLDLAQKYGLRYTRYADDITFSSQHNVYAESGDFFMELKSTIEDYGFTVNEEKTRLQKKGSRQEVTGLTVGEKVNVSRKYLKGVRSQLFMMEMRGFSAAEYRQAHGKIAYISMVRGKDDRCARRLKARLWQIKKYPLGMANYR